MRYILIFVACFFAACSNDPYKKIGKLSGLWQMTTDEGPLYEEWSNDNEGTMHGKSYMINGTDSMVFERVQLVKRDSGIFFIPVVKDQNSGQPVSFKLISSKESAFTFENKQHDFPQRVIYRFVNNDSIVARIEGDVKGELKYQEFFYCRVKK